MLPKTQRRRPDDDQRVLPLINIVFLLLIFFMLAGRLSVSDPFEVTPPLSASEGPAADSDITILVAQDRKMALDGKTMAANAIVTSVEERLSEAPSTKIRLKVDGQAETRFVVSFMQRLRAVGVVQVELLTKPRAES